MGFTPLQLREYHRRETERWAMHIAGPGEVRFGTKLKGCLATRHRQQALIRAKLISDWMERSLGPPRRKASFLRLRPCAPYMKDACPFLPAWIARSIHQSDEGFWKAPSQVPAADRFVSVNIIRV